MRTQKKTTFQVQPILAITRSTNPPLPSDEKTINEEGVFKSVIQMGKQEEESRNNGLTMDQAFKKVWGVDIEEAYWHITDIFEIVSNSQVATYNMLNMLSEAIDKKPIWDDSLLTFEDYSRTIKGVCTLVYYAFYNSTKWEKRSPIVEQEHLKLVRDSPEFYIDSVFDDIVNRCDEAEWNKVFMFLLANHLSPNKAIEVDRSELASYCWYITSMNESLYTLETKALPGIRRYFEKTEQVTDR